MWDQLTFCDLTHNLAGIVTRVCIEICSVIYPPVKIDLYHNIADWEI